MLGDGGPAAQEVIRRIEALCALGPVGLECGQLPRAADLCSLLWRGELAVVGPMVRLGEGGAALLQLRAVGETDCYAWQCFARLLPRSRISRPPARHRELVRFCPAGPGLIACRRCPARCPSSQRWLAGPGTAASRAR